MLKDRNQMGVLLAGSIKSNIGPAFSFQSQDAQRNQMQDIYWTCILHGRATCNQILLIMATKPYSSSEKRNVLLIMATKP
jgi:hypothetical protein